MPIHEQTVYPNRNKFTIPNVCKTVNTTKALVLNLGHSPLYRHFYKCLYIEMLKISLVY